MSTHPRSDALRHALGSSASSSPTAPWARCSRPRPRPSTTSRASRAATRSSTSPGPTSSGRSTTPTSRSASTASRPTPSAPTSPPSASTTSPTGSSSCPRRAPRIAREVGRRAGRTTGPAALGARLGRARAPSCRRSATSPYATLRDAYQQQSRACSPAASTRSSSRPRRTCCRPRPPIIGARRALAAAGADLPVIAQVTVETTGTMLLGSRDRRRADGAGAARHRPDRPQLRDRPGRDERAPAPPVPARPRRRSSCMPNAGLPLLGADGAHYPLTPERAGRRARRLHPRVRPRPSSAAAAARRPSTCGRSSSASAAASSSPRAAAARAGRRLALPAVPFRQDTVVPVDRRAHQRQRLARRSATRCSTARWDDCVEIARDADPRRRPPARPVHRLRRPRRRRRHARARRPLRHRSTLPLVLDSTEPAVLEAGLEMLGGRAVVNSVNYEDGDGPDVPIRADHAAGQGARRRRRSR